MNPQRLGRLIGGVIEGGAGGFFIAVDGEDVVEAEDVDHVAHEAFDATEAHLAAVFAHTVLQAKNLAEARAGDAIDEGAIDDDAFASRGHARFDLFDEVVNGIAIDLAISAKDENVIGSSV